MRTCKWRFRTVSRRNRLCGWVGPKLMGVCAEPNVVWFYWRGDEDNVVPIHVEL